ncbi:MFS transporter [Kitasatospora sp. NPDC058046]|uniref:MFS transporter n=1 Tax=Kitasatospora sp. NPDC058046 TaxID=3346312 RepID=UPI0036DCC800
MLRNRRFAFLASGQFVSALGDGMFPIAVSVKLLDGGQAGSIAGILAARAVGALAGILVAGTFVDRFSRSRVMWVADVARAATVIALIWAVSTDNLLVATICMGLLGLATSFFTPAFRSIIPRIVSAESLQQANALNSAIMQGATIGGPALGGALLVLGSPQTVMWINAASFTFSVVTLLCVHDASDPTPDRRDSVLTTALGGFRAVGEIRWLRVFMVTGVLQMALTVAPWFTFLPIISAENYGSNGPYSACMTAYALGGVCGAFIAGKVTPRLPGVAAIIGPCLFSGILFCLAAGAPVGILIAMHVIAGAGLQFSGVFQTTAIHEQIPDHLMGRVMSLTMLGGALLTPLSYSLLSPLTDMLGSRTVLISGGSISTVVLLLPLFLPDVRHLSEARRTRYDAMGQRARWPASARQDDGRPHDPSDARRGEAVTRDRQGRR